MMTRVDIEHNAARLAVLLAMLGLSQLPMDVPAGVVAQGAPRPAPSHPRAPSPILAQAGPAPIRAVADAPAPGPLADPFAPTSWAPAPAPPAPVQAAPLAAVPLVATPPAPSAPPMPFVYIGLYVDEGRETVMLMKGDQLLLVKQGETIDNVYRLERVTADRIDLTYLPLGMRQSLRTHDAA